MDGERFDCITRGFDAILDRRGALRVLGAGLVATGGSWFSRTHADAQSGPGFTVCMQDADCLDADLDPCTGSACVDGACTYFIVDCIPGHVCCGNGVCCPTGESGSCMEDADCIAVSGDPCQGFRCEAGACSLFVVSCAPGFTCCGNGVCCPDFI